MKKLIMPLLLAPVMALAHNVASNIDIVSLDDMGFPPALKQKIQSHTSEIKKNGYIKTDRPYIRQLLLMKAKPPGLARETQLGSDELKGSVKDVKTTFKFVSTLPNPKAYMGIGIESEKGWSGIKEFFDGGDAGMCTLSVFNIANLDKHIKLNKDAITYEVNDKPTSITIEGNINTGYMYEIDWYDKDYYRELECANKDIDDRIKPKMIEFAKIVDNS